MKSSRIWLVLIFVVALSLRLLAMGLFGTWDQEVNLNADEPSQIAASLASGQGFKFDFYGLRPERPLRSYIPPLYPLIMAACLRFSSEPALVLEVIQVVLSASISLFIYLVGDTLGDRVTGVLAATLVAVYPVFIIQTVEHIPFTLNAFLLTALIAACMLLLRQPSIFNAAIVGLLMGLNGLARPTTLGLLLGIIGWLWLNRHQTELPWKRYALLIGLLTLLVPTPWMVRNFQIHGEWVLISTNGGYNLWIGNNPFSTGSGWDVDLARYQSYTDRPLRLVSNTSENGVGLAIPYPLPNEIATQVNSLSEVHLDRVLFRAALSFIRSHPSAWFELALHKFWYFWWFRLNIGSFAFQRPDWWALAYQLQYFSVLLLFCFGLVVSLRQWRVYALVYYLLVYTTGVYMVFFVLTRYRWEIESFVLMFAALALVSIRDRILVLRFG